MTTQLEYAPITPWYRRRKLRRLIAWLVFLAALAIALWQFGPTIYKKCRMLYWQRQCMNHVDPPGMFHSPFPPASAPTSMPPDYFAFTEFISDRRLPKSPPAYTGVAAFESYAYLHARRSPAGRRLICAYFDPGSFEYSLSITGPQLFNQSLIVCVIEPGTLFSPPKFLAYAEFDFYDTADHIFGDYRIDSDPADDSKFILTIVTHEAFTGPTTPHTITFQIDAADKPQVGPNTLGIEGPNF